MRTLTPREAALLRTGYAEHTRVLIESPTGLMVNVSDLEGHDWVDQVTWNDDADAKITELTVRLKREVYALSLSPLVDASKLNADGPVVDAHRRVIVETAITPVDHQPEPSDWRNVFEGRSDEIDWNATPITIIARDPGADIQDTFIEDERTYGVRTVLAEVVQPGTNVIRVADAIPSGTVIVIEPEEENAETHTVLSVTGSGPYTLNLAAGIESPHLEDAVVDTRTPVETVMQDLLDDNSVDETLVVPEPSGWLVGPYKQESTSVWDALQQLANQIGWILRYVWNGDSWELRFFEPDRNTETTVHTFGPDDYLNVTRLKLDRKGIRNAVRVYYGPGDSKKYVEVDDPDSVARYGRRWMQLTPGASNMIDTEEEAERLANAALADLKDPVAEQEIELPFFPWVELGDYLGFEPNFVHYDNAQAFAVVAYKHTLSGNQTRTLITARGKPVSMHFGWLEREGRPGVAPGGRTISPPAGLTLRTGVESRDRSAWSYVSASWLPVTEVAVSQYEVQYQRTGSNDWTTAVTRSNAIRLSPLPGGITYRVRVRVISPSGTSGWSSVVTITTSENPAPGPVTGLVGSFAGRDALFNWVAPVDTPDLLGFDVEITVGSSVVRTERVAGESFAYTFDANVEDNGFPASPHVTATVYAVNTTGVRSTGESVAVSNPAPGVPTGLVVSSTLSRLTVDIDEPTFSDYWQTLIKVATTNNEAAATLVYVGQQSQGISVPIAGDGLNYVWVSFRDVFGQAGSAATGNAEAVKVTREDLQGSFFQIEPSSNPAPTSGSLEELWDADVLTGPTFNNAPVVEFSFPTEFLFDLVRFYTLDATSYWVEAMHRETGQWEAVAGTPADPLPANGGAWNVRRFDGGKMVATTRLRIHFTNPLTLTELKFGTVVLGDEILGQNITATGSMMVQSEDGSVYITSSGIVVNGQPGSDIAGATEKTKAATLPTAINHSTDHLAHFDGTLLTTRGQTPNGTPDVILRNAAGIFGGAVTVHDSLTYQVGSHAEHTVLLWRDAKRWSDYQSLTWADLEAM